MSELEAWKHADFIYASYLLVGFCVAALTVWIIKDERKQKRLLDELNAKNNTQ